VVGKNYEGGGGIIGVILNGGEFMETPIDGAPVSVEEDDPDSSIPRTPRICRPLTYAI